MEQGVNLTLKNLRLKNGKAPAANADGGGIYCENAYLTMENVTVENCTAMRFGGGIYYRVSPGVQKKKGITLTGCTLKGNSAEVSGGGLCVSCEQNASISGSVMENCTVEENKVTGPVPPVYTSCGGGVYIGSYTETTFEIKNCSITENLCDHLNATGAGLAVHCNTSSPAVPAPTLILSGTNTIDDNKTIASLGKGRGIHLHNSMLILNNTSLNLCNPLSPLSSPGSAKQDIYLKGSKERILLRGNLTVTEVDGRTPYNEITLTPEIYTDGRTVLTGAVTAGSPQNYTKFLVPDDTSLQQWSIHPDGTLQSP